MRDRGVVREPVELGAGQFECGRALDLTAQGALQPASHRLEAVTVRLHDDAHAIAAEVVQVGGACRKPLPLRGLGPGKERSNDRDEQDSETKHLGTSVD